MRFLKALLVALALGACSVPDPHYVNPDGGGNDGPVDSRYDAEPEPDAGMAAFVLSYGGTGSERVTALHGTTGGAFLLGSLESDAMLGGFPLGFGGGRTLVTAKFDTNGSPIWAETRPGLWVSGGGDAAGDLIVAGSFGGTMDFGGTPLTSAGSYDVFVAKYASSNGAHAWSVRYGASGEERAQAAFVDASGDVYVVGFFSGTTNLGGAALASAGMSDVFVAKYAGADGAHVWSLRVGGSQNDSATDVTVGDGRVIVGGVFRGTASFGGSSFTSLGQDDLFVAAYQAGGGSHVWSEQYGGTGNDSCADMILAGGALYVTGFFNTPATFGGATLVSQGSADIYLAKYDGATGSHIWSRPFGDSGTDVPTRLLADGANIVVTGRFSSMLSFGGNTVSSAGGDDVFVGTVTQADGSYVDTWRTGGTGNDEGLALAPGPSGPILGGTFQGVVYFGTTETTSAGMNDAFVYLR